MLMFDTNKNVRTIAAGLFTVTYSNAPADKYKAAVAFFAKYQVKRIFSVNIFYFQSCTFVRT